MREAAWLTQAEGGVTLRLKVVPNAPATRVDGPHGDALKLRLAAPPVDGKANAALIAFLAEILLLPRAAVQIAGGGTGRWKRVWLAGAQAPDVIRRLCPAPPDGA